MLGSMNLPAGGTPDHSPDGVGSDRTVTVADAARRHLLDEIFGDVLPEVTTDERGTGRGADDDHWYLENRPPHHG